MQVELNHQLTYCVSKKIDGAFDIGIFSNVLPYGKGYLGACRSGSANLDDMISLIHVDDSFNLLENCPITGGEDPRCFNYEGFPYALTWKPYRKGASHHFCYKVINLITKEVTTLSIEHVDETPVGRLGKNWIPLVKDGNLFFIISIDPEIMILNCDLKTGRCTWHTPYKEDLPITISRGGTNCLFSEKHNLYFGLGHRTYDCHNHQPFLYTLSKDLKERTIGSDLLPSLKGVNDPLSLYEKDSKYFCNVAFFPVQAGDTTVGHTDLYELNIL